MSLLFGYWVLVPTTLLPACVLRPGKYTMMILYRIPFKATTDLDQTIILMFAVSLMYDQMCVYLDHANTPW